MGMQHMPTWQDQSRGSFKQRDGSGLARLGKAGQRQIACIFVLGCAVGLVVGYVLMGTAHAVSPPPIAVGTAARPSTGPPPTN